jgi:serine/threonine protein kinase
MITATKAGRYEILGELGRGGMGVVYRAKDPLIGRVVAVKTIRLSEEGSGLSHEQLVERFQTEARAAGLLTHPNIVVIYDAGETDGLYYITMELVNGKSLQGLLDSGEKFPLPRLIRITEQVCSALQYAHDNKVVHRDIKPANIMLSADDQVKVTDFGTAKILQVGAAQQTSAMGTPGYMSPEQVKGNAVDGRTDIFALGVMLYELTTGQKPFRGQDIATVLYKILKEEPQPPHKLNPNISQGVSSTILKALAKNPRMRYNNCRELLDDLKNYRPGENGSDPNAPPPPKRMAERPPVPQSVREQNEKNFKPEMPKIPGVEARPNTPAPSRSKPAPASISADAHNPPPGPEPPAERMYEGPQARTLDVKLIAKIGVAIVLFAVLASFVIKFIGGMRQPVAEAPAVHQSAAAATAQTAVTDPTADSTVSTEPAVTAPRPPYASPSNPEIATLSDLAEPWSSRKFFFRSLERSKYVPAMVIRLPGSASQSNSYWAFSLDAPFSDCQFVFVDDLAKLASEYSYSAKHPMVVNPCSKTVFDPLQLRELPGNILVRGAIVQGFDARPPYGIEVKVAGDQIQAIAIE